MRQLGIFKWLSTIHIELSSYAVRSNLLPIDESCIDLLPGYNPPAPIRTTAMPIQLLVYPSNTTWRITFDSNIIQRPSVSAHITFHEYTMQLEVYRVDVSELHEVAFGSASSITISPLLSRLSFILKFDRGVVKLMLLISVGQEMSQSLTKSFGPLKPGILLHQLQIS